ERIIQANFSTINDYPFMVSIRYEGFHRCSGAIIHERYIITVAHCIKAFQGKLFDNITVVSGTTYLDKGGIIHNVDAIYYHKEFNNFNSGFNIGLIRV
ncbi:Chymotrypsin-2, partial [Harpegnathos saltator]